MLDDPDNPPIELLIEAREPLHSGLAAVQRAARTASGGAPDDANSAAALRYLRTVFLAHSQAEEFTLFTAVDGIIGQRGATTALTAQHRSIAAMCADLEAVIGRRREGDRSERLRQAEVALLHGIYAAVRIHIEAEDDAFIPLIEAHLSESQVETLVTNLRRISESVASGEAAVGPHG